MKKVTYKITSKHEVPELSTILKSNITANITLADTLKAMEDNKKGMEQIRAELGIKKALIINVETHYPEVKKVDEKMQIAIHTYYEAGRYVALGEAKLKEFEAAQKELQEEVDEIEKQTGLSKKTGEKKNKITKSVKSIYNG